MARFSTAALASVSFSVDPAAGEPTKETPPVDDGTTESTDETTGDTTGTTTP